MKAEGGGGGRKTDMNAVISDVLKYGVVVSTTLVVVGVAVLFLRAPQGFPATVQQLVSSDYGRPALDLSALFGGLSTGNPLFVIQLGLIVLLATPVARVAASIVMFAAEKDRLYVAITVFVLLVLLVGLFVVGPIEAGAG